MASKINQSIEIFVGQSPLQIPSKELTPFSWACLRSKEDEVLSCLVNEVKPDRWTLLLAINSRILRIAAAALSAGAKAETGKELSLAYRTGKMELVNIVLEAGGVPEEETLAEVCKTNNSKMLAHVLSLNLPKDPRVLNLAIPAGLPLKDIRELLEKNQPCTQETFSIFLREYTYKEKPEELALVIRQFIYLKFRVSKEQRESFMLKGYPESARLRPDAAARKDWISALLLQK